MKYRVSVTHEFVEDIIVDAASKADACEIVIADELAHNFPNKDINVNDVNGKTVRLYYAGLGDDNLEANQAE